MPDGRPVIVLILLLFILFAPDPQTPRVQQHDYFDDALSLERHALNVLNTSNYGDFNPANNLWLNISGFNNETDFEWNALEQVKEQAKKRWAHAIGEDIAKQIESEDDVALPLYRNVTGVLHGHWLHSQEILLSPPILNLTRFAPEGPLGPATITGFARNVTGRAGDLTVRLQESDLERLSLDKDATSGGTMQDAVRMITAEIGLKTTDGKGDDWEGQVHGVHFLQTGRMVLTTTSPKFAGIFGLPHMVSTPHEYNLSQELLNKTVPAAITEQEAASGRNLNPWTSLTDGSTDNRFTRPSCELVVYLMQHSAPLMSGDVAPKQSTLLHFIENELRFPTGAFIPPVRNMQFSLVAFSPDCGFAIESQGPPEYAPQNHNHLVGPKVEMEYLHGRRHILIYMTVLGCQLWLLMGQMRDASTPSTRSRISFYCISMLALGDGFNTLTFALISLFASNLWILLISTSFISFLSVSFFGMRFLMDIWSVQAPEQQHRDQQRRTAAAAEQAASAPEANNGQPPVTTQSTPETLPLPVTTPRPMDTGATPIAIPSAQPVPAAGSQLPGTAAPSDTAEEQPTSFGALYTRFYFLLLATLFLSLNATSWPRVIRRCYFTFVSFLYLSFWLPQIRRNAMRNCRRALRWDFVAGQSILRLAPFAYFYGYESNVLFARFDPISLGILASWVWLQCILMLSQEMIGPRWFVKGSWVPPAYDYHPLLREDEEGGNLPIGFSQATATAPTSPTLSAKSSESRDKGKRTFDCAICMQELEVPVIGRDGASEGGLAGSAGGLLARRGYMVTPCRHIFHSPCLEGWMKYRLQCPICREGLPPL